MDLKFRIRYTVNDVEDSVVLSGTVEEIQTKWKEFASSRSIDKDSEWSEEIT
jgi:hypothetical protein